LAPVLCLELVNLLDKYAILFFSPRAFFHFGVEDFLPAVEALDIGPVFEALSNFFPVAWLDKLGLKKVTYTHLIDKVSEFVVLYKVS
jgi:hypothetical protein